MHDSASFSPLPECVVSLLKQRNACLVTAESCTGGMLSALIVDVPGASDAFWGGYVTYANEAKMRCLGVRGDTLARHGAVSRETAREMAENLLRRAEYSFGGRAGGISSAPGRMFSLATTGVAGPGGGTPEKPVGTVWVGCSRLDRTADGGGSGSTAAMLLRIDADRRGIRTAAAHAALELLRSVILEVPPVAPSGFSFPIGIDGVERFFWEKGGGE